MSWRKGGGLYSNFVSSSDNDNTPYRGAEIPPPANLTHSRKPYNYGGISSTVPPPSSFHPSTSQGTNKQGYSTMSSISAANMSHHNPEAQEINIRRNMTEDDYFNEADETDYRIDSCKVTNKANDEELPYQPAPGSPGPPDQKKSKVEQDSDSEEDALDAFMANLEKSAQKQGVKAVDKKPVESKSSSKVNTAKSSKGVRHDIEDADDEESYYKWLEENPNAGRGPDEEDDIPIGTIIFFKGIVRNFHFDFFKLIKIDYIFFFCKSNP